MTSPHDVSTSEVEIIARAIWEARRAWARARFNDGIELEEWGDGSIPRSNGIMGEARAALTAAAQVRREQQDSLVQAITEPVETSRDHPTTEA